MTTINVTRLKHLQGISQATSLTGILVGCLVLVGWLLNIAWLKSILPDLASMKPNSALCFVLTGVALWTLYHPFHHIPHLGLGCALLVCLIAGVTFGDHLFGWESGIETLFFRPLLIDDGKPVPGQMSAGTAFNFCLLGITLILLHQHFKRWLVIQALALLTLLISAVALLGYLYHATALYQVGPHSSMALHTAGTFALLSLGILFWRADVGLLTAITSDELGGKIARVLIPAIIGIPIVLGWFRLKGQELGYYDTSFGLSIMITSMIVIMVMLVWRNAYQLNQIDIQRQKIELERLELLQHEQKAKKAALEAQICLANLAKISLELSSTLDYPETLQRVAQMSVPDFSDICAVDLLGEDNLLHRVAVGHVDPAKADLVMQALQKFPPKQDLKHGPYYVVHTGQVVFNPQVSQETIEKYAINEEHLQYLRAITPCESLLVPISLREKTFGVISFISTQDDRHYQPEDITYAQELARRAAIAIENAQLFQQTQQLNADLERRVQERTLEFSLVNKELESFSYSVSHDLRAPLRALDGFSQALCEDYMDTLDEEGKKYLQRIRNASQRMGLLIDDLLMLSRVTRTQVQFRHINLSAMARQIEEDLREFYPNCPVQFVVAENMFTDADERLMHVVLTNLLGNAWKFSSKTANPCVEFGFQERGDELEYFIRDNGIGFDMAYVHKLFGAFQRLHSNNDFEGTGIGLATVQRILQKHGGSVRAEGVVGQGATFYFQI